MVDRFKSLVVISGIVKMTNDSQKVCKWIETVMWANTIDPFIKSYSKIGFFYKRRHTAYTLEHTHTKHITINRIQIHNLTSSTMSSHSVFVYDLELLWTSNFKSLFTRIKRSAFIINMRILWRGTQENRTQNTHTQKKSRKYNRLGLYKLHNMHDMLIMYWLLWQHCVWFNQYVHYTYCTYTWYIFSKKRRRWSGLRLQDNNTTKNFNDYRCWSARMHVVAV